MHSIYWCLVLRLCNNLLKTNCTIQVRYTNNNLYLHSTFSSKGYKVLYRTKGLLKPKTMIITIKTTVWSWKHTKYIQCRSGRIQHDKACITLCKSDGDFRDFFSWKKHEWFFTGHQNRDLQQIIHQDFLAACFLFFSNGTKPALKQPGRLWHQIYRH